jgi:hypothetical protein
MLSTRDAGRLHEFLINYSALQVEYEQKIDRIKANGQSLDVLYTNIITFQFGLYREPESMLITLFMPNYLLIFLVFLTFEQEARMNDKMSNLVTILLALLAYQ